MAGYYQTGTMLRAEWEELQKGTVAQLRTSYEEYLKRLGINSEAEAIALRAKEEAEGKGFGAQQAAIDAGVFGTNTRADRKISDAEEAANQAAQLSNDSYAAKQIQALTGGRITGREPVYIFGTPEHTAFMKAQLGSGKPPVAPDAYLDAQAFNERFIEYSRLGGTEPTVTVWDDATKQYVTKQSPWFNPKVLEVTPGMGTQWDALNRAKWATVGAGGRTAATEQAEYDILNFFSNTVGGLPAGYRFFMRTPGDITGGGATTATTPAGTTGGKTVVSTVKDANGNTITYYTDGTSSITKATTATTEKTITQADIDAAVNKAISAATAQSKADAAAAKFATKTKASDRLKAMFDGVGLGSLAAFIDKRIMEDASEEAVLLELYEQPEYQLRFPGMKALRAKGKTISEADYIKDEKAFTQTARFFDIPVGFYDTPDDFGKLIGNLVSPKEYQDRLQVGQDLARSMSPSARAQLQEFHNIGEGGITAYVLDSERALPLLQRQAKSAQFVGYGREKGFKLEGMTAAQAEQIVGTEAYFKLSAQQMETALGQAAQLRQNQSRLAGIEGEVYNENQALQAVIEGSPEALLASQQRAQREGARFGGGTGISGSSLRSQTTI